jgi:hypothetical protein
MHEFGATTQNFSPAIIELDAAMRAGRLHHADHPVLTWCISDAVGKADRRGNLYPASPNQRAASTTAPEFSIPISSHRRPAGSCLGGFLTPTLCLSLDPRWPACCNPPQVLESPVATQIDDHLAIVR